MGAGPGGATARGAGAGAASQSTCTDAGDYVLRAFVCVMIRCVGSV